MLEKCVFTQSENDATFTLLHPLTVLSVVSLLNVILTVTLSVVKTRCFEKSSELSLFVSSFRILTIQHGRALVFGLVVCSTTTPPDQSQLCFQTHKACCGISRHNRTSVNLLDKFYIKIFTTFDSDTTTHTHDCSYAHKQIWKSQ